MLSAIRSTARTPQRDRVLDTGAQYLAGLCLPPRGILVRALSARVALVPPGSGPSFARLKTVVIFDLFQYRPKMSDFWIVHNLSLPARLSAQAGLHGGGIGVLRRRPLPAAPQVSTATALSDCSSSEVQRRGTNESVPQDPRVGAPARRAPAAGGGVPAVLAAGRAQGPDVRAGGARGAGQAPDDLHRRHPVRSAGRNILVTALCF